MRLLTVTLTAYNNETKGYAAKTVIFLSDENDERKLHEVARERMLEVYPEPRFSNPDFKLVVVPGSPLSGLLCVIRLP